ncbi:MAG: HAD-IA family hydrolase [Clostridiales bacterium]|nr:HAD-IA family hydrolase [Clostridiales bacterium]
MFNTFIFDFDLTLADSSKGILICFKHTLETFGYEVPDDIFIFNTIGLTLEDAFTVLTGVTDTDIKARMRKCYASKADEVMAKNTHFYEGVIDVLKSLKENKFNVGIVSTKYRYRIIENFKMIADFTPDFIVGGEDVTFHKPNPFGLNFIIKKLDVDKSQVLYIGDSYIDAQTAENSGVAFAGVLTGSTSREEFTKFKCAYIEENVPQLFNKNFK